MLFVDCRYFKGNSHSIRLCRFCSMVWQMQTVYKMYATFCLASLPHASFTFTLRWEPGLMSILSSKLEKVNASYVYKYNSILRDFHVFHSISSIYHIIMHFFEKYAKIKIEDHKILVRINKLSPKFDEINASYTCKCNSILWDLHVLYQFST